MAKKKVITIRVTDEEKKMIDRKANERRMTITQMIMHLIYRYVDNIR